jgi:hypothetical protein
MMPFSCSFLTMLARLLLASWKIGSSSFNISLYKGPFACAVTSMACITLIALE